MTGQMWLFNPTAPAHRPSEEIAGNIRKLRSKTSDGANFTLVHDSARWSEEAVDALNVERNNDYS